MSGADGELASTLVTRLTLVPKRVEAGKVHVRAEVEGKTVFSDVLDPRRSRSREQFLQALKAKLPSIDVDECEEQLLQLAGDDVSAASSAPAQGKALEFETVEPWSDAVDGSELLDELSQLLERFVVLPSACLVMLPLWIAHTYLFDKGLVSPRLGIVSATKRCGKTRLLTILGALVHKPLQAASLTAPATFRVTESYRPTLLIDEADTFLRDNEALRGVLNSGFEAGGQILRCVGDGHEARAFATFAPAAIALIGHLPATVEDRSILVRMQRKTKASVTDRLPVNRMKEFLPLRRRLQRLAMDIGDQLDVSEVEDLEQLHDRAADLWRPLLAIAEQVSEDWRQRARCAALELSGELEESEVSVRLLKDLRCVFDAHKKDRLPTRTLIETLVEIDGAPWSEYSRGRPITPPGIARVLSSFRIVPGTIRVNEKTPKGYKRSQFEDAWNRYL